MPVFNVAEENEKHRLLLEQIDLVQQVNQIKWEVKNTNTILSSILMELRQKRND